MTEAHVIRMGRQWLRASGRERRAVAPEMREAYMHAAIDVLHDEVRQLHDEVRRLRAAAGRAEAGEGGRQVVRDGAWPSESDVLEAVARRCGVTVTDIRGPRQARAIVRPRQIAMWLLVRAAGLTQREAAAACGRRDHATVVHAIRCVEGDGRLLDIARGLAEACGWRVEEDADAHQ